MIELKPIGEIAVLDQLAKRHQPNIRHASAAHGAGNLERMRAPGLFSVFPVCTRVTGNTKCLRMLQIMRV